MSGAEQRTAGASWDDPIELDVSSPVRGERAKSDQDTSNHGDDSGTGSHLDDAIDVDALVEEPTVEDEHVHYYVYPKDEEDNVQEDPPTAPEDDDECVEVAHSATLAFIESKLKKTDPITHGILKKRKSFLTLYRRHADLRCWRVKRCEDYDRMKKVRPFTLAKDWHAAGLYKKLIKFYANRIPTERLPEGEDAIYNGESLDDAARTQAHKNAILKYPDRRLYDAMARAKRIETLVTWKHANEDAFMGEFKAEFGTTFGLNTGKEVITAFMSAGEAVENTWDRNFRGDPVYNGFLDGIMGKPTLGVLGLNGNDCLELNAVRAITGKIAAAARRKAAAVAKQPLLTAFAQHQQQQQQQQQAVVTPPAAAGAAPLPSPAAVPVAPAAATAVVDSASTSASTSSSSASTSSSFARAPAGGQLSLTAAFAQQRQKQVATATSASAPQQATSSLHAGALTTATTSTSTTNSTTIAGGLREMPRMSPSFGSKAAALALANGGVLRSLEHYKDDNDNHRRRYDVFVSKQILGERVRFSLTTKQLDALGIDDDSYLTSTRVRLHLERRPADGKPLAFIGTVADLQFMTKWRLIVTYRGRSIELDWRSGSCLPELGGRLFAVLGKHLGVAPLEDLVLPPDAVDPALIKAQPAGWTREDYCQTVASLLFAFRSSVYEANDGAYYGTRVRTRGATKSDILLMPPADRPADELDIVYGTNPYTDKIRYTYVPEGKKSAPKTFYDFDGSRMQAHADVMDLARVVVGMDAKGRDWGKSERVPTAMKERMLLGDGAAMKSTVSAFGVMYKRREPMGKPVPRDKPLTLQIIPHENKFVWTNEETGEVAVEVIHDGDYGWALMKGAKDYVAAGKLDGEVEVKRRKRKSAGKGGEKDEGKEEGGAVAGSSKRQRV